MECEYCKLIDGGTKEYYYEDSDCAIMQMGEKIVAIAKEHPVKCTTTKTKILSKLEEIGKEHLGEGTLEMFVTSHWCAAYKKGK